MYKSIILPLAKEDIQDASLWYNGKQKGLGKIFTKEVRKKVHFITQNPNSCNIRYDNIRTAVLDVFPFMLHYTVDENNKTVLISAVLHTSRNPDIWRTR